MSGWGSLEDQSALMHYFLYFFNMQQTVVEPLPMTPLDVTSTSASLNNPRQDQPIIMMLRRHTQVVQVDRLRLGATL